jgi:site-specific DNA-adenine methylase
VTLRPFFPYYGSKWRSAPLYPRPEHDHVIEPFAGSAGYACRHEPRHVLLVDADPIIAGVWDYLIHASQRDVLSLPGVAAGQDVRELGVSQEAAWLIGFWINRGAAQPRNVRTAYSTRTERGQLVWGERARQRIASQLERIRHWRVEHGTYEQARNGRATYFVDPPYGEAGKHYKHRDVDYAALASWCSDLDGQVIVCENEGADWLPFRPLASIKASRGRSAEAIWTNGGHVEQPIQLGFDDQGDDAALVAYVKAAGWHLWARADGSKPVWADPTASIEDRAYHTLSEAVRIQRARDAVPGQR